MHSGTFAGTGLVSVKLLLPTAANTGIFLEYAFSTISVISDISLKDERLVLITSHFSIAAKSPAPIAVTVILSLSPTLYTATFTFFGELFTITLLTVVP